LPNWSRTVQRNSLALAGAASLFSQRRTMMISVCCQDHFDRIVAEAQERGLMADLQAKLDYLGMYGCHEDKEYTRCKLYYDFAPLSFAFAMEKRDTPEAEYQYWFNGGLIFHPGAGQPDRSCSVELCPSKLPHWSIHT
jgi:hypothetical protein